MKIKVEPFLIKKGNRVAKAAIEFEETDSFLAGFHMIGFTICDDKERGLFVLFPSSIIQPRDNQVAKNRTFFFLKPENTKRLEILEHAILDVYEKMVGEVTAK